ncbi:hypothetical protein [Bacillus phage Negev_SA]|uniref:Uncharacterized protein n=1 Tax=Bacillus phage Negev_SA TaxID=1983579 RepID=A0A288WG34_9CAUD|nr:hypothetical protein P9C72_gp29 [Bacillus phage Negev_SA]ARW58511.1 hypothetical protein [Bacillus phage Negev_SA]
MILDKLSVLLQVAFLSLKLDLNLHLEKPLNVQLIFLVYLLIIF